MTHENEIQDMNEMRTLFHILFLPVDSMYALSIAFVCVQTKHFTN